MALGDITAAVRTIGYMPAVILRARSLAGLELAEVAYTAGQYGLTSPSSVLEVILVLRGVFGGATAGRVVARRPGAPRVTVPPGTSATCFVIRMDEGWRSLSPTDLSVAATTTIRVVGATETLLREAHREFTRDEGDSLILEGLLVAAFGHVLRAFRPSARSAMVPASVRAALNALHEDVATSRAELARRARVDRAHLAREFRKYVGCSIDEYRRRLRVAAACALMRDPARALAGIAVECGFADAAHFSRTFRAVTGQAPRAYRASLDSDPGRRTARAARVVTIDPVGTFAFSSCTAAGLRYNGTLVIEGATGAYRGDISTDVMPDMTIDSIAVQGRSMVVTCMAPAGAVVVRLHFDGGSFTGTWHLGATSRPVRGRRISSRDGT